MTEEGKKGLQSSIFLLKDIHSLTQHLFMIYYGFNSQELKNSKNILLVKRKICYHTILSINNTFYRKR